MARQTAPSMRSFLALAPHPCELGQLSRRPRSDFGRPIAKPLRSLLVSAAMRNRVRTRIPRCAISHACSHYHVRREWADLRKAEQKPTTKRPPRWLSSISLDSSLARLNSPTKTQNTGLSAEKAAAALEDCQGACPASGARRGLRWSTR